MKIISLKKFLSPLSVVLGCLLILTSGCDEKRTASNRPHVLIMGTSGDFPPFEFYQTDKNADHMVGFDIELAGRICKFLGYKLEVRDIDFSALIPALQSGQVDFVMAGITPTDERKKAVDFSSVYFMTSNVLVTLSGHGLNKTKTFKGKKIGVQLGSTQEQFARFWAEQKHGLELVPLDRVTDLIQELLAKRIDGVILENTVAAAYAAQNPNAYAIEPLEKHQEGMSIVFPKGSPLTRKFDRALAHLREIGYLQKLTQKWFGASGPL